MLSLTRSHRARRNIINRYVMQRQTEARAMEEQGPGMGNHRLAKKSFSSLFYIRKGATYENTRYRGLFKEASYTSPATASGSHQPPIIPPPSFGTSPRPLDSGHPRGRLAKVFN
jgi:hypothetical protein